MQFLGEIGHLIWISKLKKPEKPFGNPCCRSRSKLSYRRTIKLSKLEPHGDVVLSFFVSVCSYR